MLYWRYKGFLETGFETTDRRELMDTRNKHESITQGVDILAKISKSVSSGTADQSAHTEKDDLFRYQSKGRVATTSSNVHLVEYKDFQSRVGECEVGTLETALVAKRSCTADSEISLDSLFLSYQGERKSQSGGEDKRNRLWSFGLFKGLGHSGYEEDSEE